MKKNLIFLATFVLFLLYSLPVFSQDNYNTLGLYGLNLGDDEKNILQNEKFKDLKLIVDWNKTFRLGFYVTNKLPGLNFTANEAYNLPTAINNLKLTNSITQYFIVYNSKIGDIWFLHDNLTKSGKLAALVLSLKDGKLKSASEVLTERYGKPKHFPREEKHLQNCVIWEKNNTYAFTEPDPGRQDNGIIKFYDANLLNDFYNNASKIVKEALEKNNDKDKM